MKLLHFPRDKEEIASILEKAELASLMVPFVTEDAVKETCRQAVKYGMAAVLAVPDICSQTAKILKGTGVAPVCVVSAMEVGDNDHAGRLNCIREQLKLGVCDVDIGVPIGMVLDGEFSELTKEIKDMAELLHAKGGRLGVILEIDQFNATQLFGLCDSAVAGGADYLRISSGMEAIGAVNIGRATIHNVAALHERYGGKIKIKAGGGWDFAYLEDCVEYIESGASRVDAGPCTITQLEQIGYGRG